MQQSHLRLSPFLNYFNFPMSFSQIKHPQLKKYNAFSFLHFEHILTNKFSFVVWTAIIILFDSVEISFFFFFCDFTKKIVINNERAIKNPRQITIVSTILSSWEHLHFFPFNNSHLCTNNSSYIHRMNQQIVIWNYIIRNAPFFYKREFFLTFIACFIVFTFFGSLILHIEVIKNDLYLLLEIYCFDAKKQNQMILLL